MALLYGFSILYNQSTTLVDGRRAFWLHDDMMITMRYARNLVDGYGLVWNPGQPPVEGYSNFGWLLVMAAVHLLPFPDTLTSLVILLINIFLTGLVLFLTTRLAQRLELKPGVWLLAALLTLIVVVDLARWTIIGLEVPLQTAVFLWLLIRVLDEGKQKRPDAVTFLLAGLLGLIRIDGPLLAAILCLIAFGLQPNKKRVLAYTPLILILPLAHILFRLAYYGYPLPNTYYLKLVAWDARFLPGMNYLMGFILRYSPIIIAALAGALFAREKRRWLLLSAIIPLAAYVLFAGGDDFGGARFFAPLLPVFFLLAFNAPSQIVLPDRPFQMILVTILLVIFTIYLNPFIFFPGPGEEAVLTEAGTILKDQTTPNTTIGVFWAGTLPYFAHRPAVDMLGKNDAYIARLPANEGSFKPGHNKFDYTHSLSQLQPDAIVSPLNLSLLTDSRSFELYTVGDNAYSGLLFLDETFQAEYAPTLLIIETMPLFISTHSPEREKLLSQATCDPVTDQNLRKFGLETLCWLNGR
jgi:hypothetical protein